MNKVKKLFSRGSKKESNRPTKRQTVEQHREIVLEQGRKFKYPIQYSKHKILINALIIGVAVIGLFILFSWWMLYHNQARGDFFYTAVRVIPIPVANVDGEPVRFGDYMRRIRASLYYLERQENVDFNSEDGLLKLNHNKRVSMDEALQVGLATKIAREYNLSVDESEIDGKIEQSLVGDNGAKISQRAYETLLWRSYGWSIDDYREIVRQSLLLSKASFVIDTGARDKISAIKKQLNEGADFAELAKTESQDEATKGNGGDVGNRNTGDFDANGLIAVAGKMNVGEVSALIQGVDAWYIIKLTEKTDQTVRYSMIKINLTEFSKRFAQLREDGKIREYIEIKTE